MNFLLLIEILIILFNYNIIQRQMEIPDLDFRTPKVSEHIYQNQQLFSINTDSYESDTPETGVQASFQQDFNPIIEDKIQKKTMNVSWNERYFSLSKTRLLYYSNQQKKLLKGCFNFISLSKYKLEVREEQKNLRLALFVNLQFNQQHHQKQLLSLNFQSNPQKFLIWKKQLNSAIKNISKEQISQSHTIPATQIINTQQKIQGFNFWNKITISMNQLHKFVSHLDIVFFKSSSPISSLHRLLMRSKFDHVGLLFKDSSNRLLILQAIQSRGVWINQWNHMMPIFREHYDQIAIKKLLLSHQFKIDFNKLQQYVDAVIGRKYQLSLSKLFMGQNNSNTQQLQDSPTKQNKNTQQVSKKNIEQPEDCKKINKQKTYFCSELIADIYIQIGLIKGKKRNQFWPRDFEDDQLHLQNNCKLSQLMYLDY